MTYIIENALGHFLDHHRWNREYKLIPYRGTYGDPGSSLGALVRFIKSQGITIRYAKVHEAELEGDYDYDHNIITLSSSLKRKEARARRFIILIHEYVHHVLDYMEFPYHIKRDEFIAEVVAYVVGKIFGVRHHDVVSYIKMYQCNRGTLFYHYDKIDQVAKKIIRGIERNL